MLHDRPGIPEFSDGRVLRRCDVSGLILGEVVYAPHCSRPPHGHKRACLHFLLRGGYVEYQGTRSHECHPLTVSFQPEGHEHSYRCSAAASRSLTIEFEPAWTGRLREYGVKLQHAINLRSPLLQWFLARLYREFSLPETGSALVIESLALELAVEISRQQLPRSDLRPHWLSRVIAFLHEHFVDSPSLTEIARRAEVHPVHLARTFRRHCRCTVGEYLRQLRVTFACQQLTESSRPLIEIALAAGFSDQSQFSRTFKRVMGLTPAAFRAATRMR
jgi:AraC family transcriptional regulator